MPSPTVRRAPLATAPLRSPLHLKLCLVVALAAAWPSPAGAQEVPQLVRGPYLQSASPERVVVRWRTDVESASVVRWGFAPEALVFEAGTAAPAIDHQVAIDGLPAAGRFYYSVGDGSTVLAGGDLGHSFRTAPPAGSDAPLRIWAFGDSGFLRDSLTATRDAFVDWAGARRPDVWLLLGDNAYDNASDAEYQERFFEPFADLLADTAVWSTFGNHEGRSSVSAVGFGPYYEMFTFPTAGEAGGVPSGTEAYYSFDHGNVHFVCLNSHDLPRQAGSDMLAWLEDDLGASDAEWTIVFFHHPPYSKGSHDSDFEIGADSFLSIREMRENVLPILDTHGVDLVLTGHSHSYERSFLLDGHYGTSETLAAENRIDDGDGRLDRDGAYRKPGGPTPHTGAVYAVVGSFADVGPGSYDHPVMVSSLAEHGSLVLDVSAARLDATFLGHGGVVLDRFALFRGDGDLPPLAGPDRAIARPGVPVVLDVLANDTDPEAGALAVTALGAVHHGIATIEPDGRVRYTADPGFEGRESFTYTVSDPAGNRNLGVVTLAVFANHPPVAAPDAAATPRDRAVELDLLANDSDPDGDPLTLAALGAASRGTVDDLGGGRVRYTPDPGFTGRDRFTYAIDDGQGGTAEGEAAIAVTCPPLTGGPFEDDFEPAAEPGWTIDTAVNDAEVSPTWTLLPDPAAHSPSQSFFSDASTLAQSKDDRLVSPPLDLAPSSRLTFWHRFSFESGFDGGVLEVSDDGGASWQDLGDHIVAGGYTSTLDPASAFGARPAWTGDSGAAMGRVEVDLGAFAGPGRRLRWRLGCDFITLPFPPPGPTGWWVDDVTVTDLVIAPGDCNLPPEPADDEATTEPGKEVRIDVLANDSDPNNDELEAVEVGSPANGTAALNGDGTVTYTPAPGFEGFDAFGYRVSDGRASAAATVHVTVAAPGTASRTHGQGTLAADCVPRFSFHARRRGGEPEGRLSLRIDCAGGEGSLELSGTVTELTLAGPAADFAGSCRLADGESCRFEALAEDLGQPSAGVDRLRVEIFAADGSSLRRVEGVVASGNVRVH